MQRNQCESHQCKTSPLSSQLTSDHTLCLARDSIYHWATDTQECQHRGEGKGRREKGRKEGRKGRKKKRRRKIRR
jgi:hypothetical protein